MWLIDFQSVWAETFIKLREELQITIKKDYQAL